jgi:hypothetical protein
MGIRHLFLWLFGLVSLGVAAQNSQVLYFMNLPQNHLLNPALKPQNSVYVGLPVISGIDLNLTNTVVNFSDVLAEGVKTSESTVPFMNPGYDVDAFLRRVKKFNYFDAQVSLQLLGVGFSLKDNLYLFMDITDHFQSNIVVPGDIFELAFRGNDKYYGTTLNLTALNADIKYYREVGVGFSKKFTDKVRIGAKGKFLFGIAAANVENNLLSINVADDYSHTFNTDISLNISAPVKVTTVSGNDDHLDSFTLNEDSMSDDPGDVVRYMTNTRNMGFGIDLGAEFNVTDKIVVSAAITDLGFIRWKSDLVNLKTDDQIDFSGLNMEEVYNGNSSFEDISNGMIDSIKSSLVVTRMPEPFTTILPSGWVLAGRYIINDYLSAGLLSYSKLTGRQVREALTLSANLNLNNFFSTTLAYTVCNRQYNHLGFGFAIRGLFAQIYFLLDNIPLTWSKTNFGDEEFKFPEKWDTLHARTGFNLVFGNRYDRVKKIGDHN